MVGVDVAPSRAVFAPQPPRKDELVGVYHHLEEERFLQVGDTATTGSTTKPSIISRTPSSKLSTLFDKLKADTFSGRVSEIDELEKLLHKKIEDTSDSEEVYKALEGEGRYGSYVSAIEQIWFQLLGLE